MKTNNTATFKEMADLIIKKGIESNNDADVLFCSICSEPFVNFGFSEYPVCNRIECVYKFLKENE